MKGKVLVSQLCPSLCNPMDCSPPGSSVHGILLARTLEWIAIPFSRGSSWSRDRTRVSCIAGRFFTIWATRVAIMLIMGSLNNCDRPQHHIIYRIIEKLTVFVMPAWSKGLGDVASQRNKYWLNFRQFVILKRTVSSTVGGYLSYCINTTAIVSNGEIIRRY